MGKYQQLKEKVEEMENKIFSKESKESYTLSFFFDWNLSKPTIEDRINQLETENRLLKKYLDIEINRETKDDWVIKKIKKNKKHD